MKRQGSPGDDLDNSLRNAPEPFRRDAYPDRRAASVTADYGLGTVFRRSQRRGRGLRIQRAGNHPLMGSSQNLLRRRVVGMGYVSIRGVRSDRGFMAIARAMGGRRAATAIAIPIFPRLRSRLPRHTPP